MNKTKAIKLYCRECAGGSYGEVLCCHLLDCPLWPFRTGYSAKSNKKSLEGYLEKHPDVADELKMLEIPIVMPILGRTLAPAHNVARKLRKVGISTGKED